MYITTQNRALNTHILSSSDSGTEGYLDKEVLCSLPLCLPKKWIPEEERGLPLCSVCIIPPANESTTAGLNAEVEVHCQRARKS